jgi:hypothetical protein
MIAWNVVIVSPQPRATTRSKAVQRTVGDGVDQSWFDYGAVI